MSCGNKQCKCEDCQCGSDCQCGLKKSSIESTQELAPAIQYSSPASGYTGDGRGNLDNNKSYGSLSKRVKRV